MYFLVDDFYYFVFFHVSVYNQVFVYFLNSATNVLLTDIYFNS
jgi:hypothetical protein